MDDAIRLLLVEDNPVESAFLEAILGRLRAPAVSVCTVGTMADTLSELERERFDIVLLDMSLPDGNGLETLRRLRCAAPGLPVVVLMEICDEQQALFAVKEGAHDYLLKRQIEAPLLGRALQYAMERERLLTELRQRDCLLGQHQKMLSASLARLADGDLSVRTDWSSRHLSEVGSGLEGTLRRFDRTMEQLQSLSNLRALSSSMISHDLRSELNTAMVALAVIEGAACGLPEHRKYAGMVRRKLQSVLQLAEDLLEVSRVHSVEPSLNKTEVDLNELLGACVNDLQVVAQARHQTLQVHHPDGPLTVHCDRAKIRRVVENLVGNAIKYSVDGDTIEIRANQWHLQHVSIQVRDHGPGITWEDHERMFDLSYRGTNKADQCAGNGLGLGICRAFVKAHDGHLWALSEADGGASFVFALPR